METTGRQTFINSTHKWARDTLSTAPPRWNCSPLSRVLQTLHLLLSCHPCPSISIPCILPADPPWPCPPEASQAAAHFTPPRPWPHRSGLHSKCRATRIWVASVTLAHLSPLILSLSDHCLATARWFCTFYLSGPLTLMQPLGGQTKKVKSQYHFNSVQKWAFTAIFF